MGRGGGGGGHRARLRGKELFISLTSLVSGRCLMFCTRARSCADDAKIVRSRNAQCKTRESPYGEIRRDKQKLSSPIGCELRRVKGKWSI